MCGRYTLVESDEDLEAWFEAMMKDLHARHATKKRVGRMAGSRQSQYEGFETSAYSTSG